MRDGTLIQQHPPTPPNAGAEYQAGLQQVAQYNADRSYSFETEYGSPGSVAYQGNPSRPSHADEYGRGLGISIQYDGYGPPTEYRHSGSYNDQAPFSPPTPRSANGDEPNRRVTRSGRKVTTPNSPKAAEARQRPRPKGNSRKAKAAKGDKKIPKLTAPLSVLTKDLHDVPIKNMEEWVNRPMDVRRREAEKRNGYITRPMNSFMLYRSAFAERAKSWCLQNNHQIVSTVAGESWPLEPPEIRELYNEYAKLERINHQNAHPTYKFSPSKTAVPIKRRTEWSEDEEPSDSDDAEWTSGARRPPPRPTKHINRSSSYPSSGVGPDHFDGAFGPNPNGVNKSTWDMANNRRPLPMLTPMSQNDVHSHYFEPGPYPVLRYSPNFPTDMYMTKLLDAPTPLVQLQSNPLMIGLPRGNANDQLLELHPNVCTSVDEEQVDPTLLAYGDNHSEIDPTSLPHGQTSLQEAVAQHNLDDLLVFQTDDCDYQAWQSDPTLATFEPESEFDKWLAD
ncbi:uncharacterized protein yc1106_01728 [Curvularia clavata]|uniref:HMG box domain-containing protein n=1 Tax=Curvularia clavata TaxID=95742 RepID=A0A9Q9DQA1_CURCL|nr:uncharacterized protein yc1106_01728 [Curvularia clavata]